MGHAQGFRLQLSADGITYAHSFGKTAMKSRSARFRGSNLRVLLDSSARVLRGIFTRDPRTTFPALAKSGHDLLNVESFGLFLVSSNPHPRLKLEASSTDKPLRHYPLLLDIHHTIGQGLTGALASDETQDVFNFTQKDLQADPFVKRIGSPHLLSGKCYSLIATKLRNRKGKVIGLIKAENKKGISSRYRRCFSAADVTLLKILAHSIVIAQENLIVFNTFQSFLQGLQKAENLDEVLSVILQSALALVQAERGEFALVRKDGKLSIGSTEGPTTAAGLSKGDQVPKRSFMGTLWKNRNKDWLKTGNVQRRKSLGQYFETHPNTKSEIAIVFRINGKRIGILNAESFVKGFFDRIDLKILKLFARSAALSIDAEQKRAYEQTELKKQRYLLNAIMDNVPDSIYFKGRNSSFIQINRGLASRFNLADPSEAIGKSDHAYFDPEHANRARADELAIMASGDGIIAKEEKEVYPDKRVAWVLSTKLPLKTPQGKIVGTFGISHDITQRKVMEQQVMEANAALEISRREASLARAKVDLRLDRAQAIAKIGFWEWNIVEDDYEVSEEFYRVFGLSPGSELKLRKLRAMVHVDDLSKWDRHFDAVRERRIPSTFTVRITTSSNELKWIEGKSEIGERDEEGNVRTMIGTVQDVTRREETELSLTRIRAQLDEAARLESIGVMAASVAHDIRSNIGALQKCFASILDQVACNRSQNKLNDYLDTAHAHIKAVLSTSQDFFTMRPNRDFEGQYVDLNVVLSRLFEIMEAEFQRSNIKCVCALSPTLPKLHLDPPKIRSAFSNFFSNSIDFMPTGGQLHLRTWCDLRNYPQCVYAEVLDTGPGFADEILAHPFTPFVTKKPSGHGTGLGLVAARHIIESLHHGRITLANHPESGAALVTVRLPLKSKTKDKAR